MTAGRPTLYTDDLTYEICGRLANGESLSSICRDKSMPYVATVYRWLNEKEEFRERYGKAREDQADTLADEILKIADDGTNDYMETLDGENIAYKTNGENIQRSRLRVDARKWVAAKLKPKKYGEKITNEMTGADGSKLFEGIQIEIVRPPAK